jgi:2,5-dihydroxypyridine 5,6-dioxygenase
MVTWQYRNAMGAATDLIPLFRQVLEHCRVGPGQRVLVYCDHHSPEHYAAAFVSAAQLLEAEVFQLVIPTQQPDILQGPVWDMWHSIDMVVDLESIMTSVYRPLRVSAMEAGVRVLRVTEPEEVLFRLPPDPVVRDRVKRAETLLRDAAEFRVTSAAGTDLVVNVSGRQAFGLWGVVDQPGMWDHWPVGLVVGGASRPQTNGRIVIDMGDLLLGLQRYVTTSITITVKEGIITAIEGEVDAELLRQWFQAANDPRAYHISHIGWGCDYRADWSRMARKTPGGVGDVESVAGMFQIAFGRDTSWYIGDGTNDVAAHMDFNCLRNNVWLDGTPIIENGALIHPALR